MHARSEKNKIPEFRDTRHGNGSLCIIAGPAILYAYRPNCLRTHQWLGFYVVIAVTNKISSILLAIYAKYRIFLPTIPIQELYIPDTIAIS